MAPVGILAIASSFCLGLEIAVASLGNRPRESTIGERNVDLQLEPFKDFRLGCCEGNGESPFDFVARARWNFVGRFATIVVRDRDGPRG